MARHTVLPRRGVFRPPRRGYVLVFVLAALVMMALIGGRFAIRIDALRDQTGALSAYARGRLEAGNAAAAAFYLISTQPRGPAGFGSFLQPALRADGRPYRLDNGAEIRLQDTRGLYPINNLFQRESFAALLRLSGADVVAIDGYTDVLLDYQDTDNLKRLNGAERADYAALGLPPVRNDWLLSLRELSRMPLWRDRPELVAAIEPFVSTSRDGLFNANTAPRLVLQAKLPQARPEQIELFETLRSATPFTSESMAIKATGLQLATDESMLHVGNHFRLNVWAAGMPQAIQYNVSLDPVVAMMAPWQIAEVHSVTRPIPSKAQERASAFPLALAPASP